MKTGVEKISAKTILSRYPGRDPFFHIRYSMNLYRGCMHACIYCDTRSDCYRIGDLSQIRVKENALILLRNELKRLRKKDTIGTGSMNDPYMPAEAVEKLTRGALGIISSFRFPIHIMTKSDLVLRDTDLISDIARTFATVSFTITSAADSLSSVTEPGAPVSSVRFSAIRKLSDAGINSGVLLMPVLPHITDTPENIREIIVKAADHGASYVIPAFGMTLRDSQKKFYFEKLRALMPDIYEKYIAGYRNTYYYPSPEARRLEDVFNETCSRYGLQKVAPAYTEKNIQQRLFGDE